MIQNNKVMSMQEQNNPLKMITAAVLLLFSIHIQAQIVYYDAIAFPLLGKIGEQTETRYERFPAKFKDVLSGKRPSLWSGSKQTAGLAVRFSSNSTHISARWDPDGNTMNHMATTGVQGLDLYCLEGNEWRYVCTARPHSPKGGMSIISNMEAKEREFMLFLPLYDSVRSLEIGIDSLAWIAPPKVALPVREKPVVAYGTSILQGGCASRPGMAHSNILTRKLNREMINLGFSGNGLLDLEVAEWMAECDASLYILDFMPNVEVPMIEERLEKFYDILRSKRPDVPIFFIEAPDYTHNRYDLKSKARNEGLNKALHKVFDTLEKRGDKHIHLISSKGMTGTDGEEAVDGIHLTDLGFFRYAEYLYPKIKSVLDARVYLPEKE
jgi:hypothetical protein